MWRWQISLCARGFHRLIWNSFLENCAGRSWLKACAALAAAIGEAIESPNEAFKRGMAGRTRMLQKFSWQSTAKKTEAAIQTELDRLRTR